MANYAESKPYVWYASYGSNLLRERFLCYILGGTPEGATRNHTGSTDKTLPRDDQPIEIPYPLYFAEMSASWQNAGVAFIGDEKVSEEPALGRMYRITAEQFVHVVRQENGLEPEDDSLKVDLDAVEKQGQMNVGAGWYGKIIYLGRQGGYPIYTFTSPKEYTQIAVTRPGENYLKTIARGIHQTYGYKAEKIADYFLSKPGVAGKWTREELLEQIGKNHQ